MFNFYISSKFIRRFTPIILVVVIFSGLFLVNVNEAEAGFFIGLAVVAIVTYIAAPKVAAVIEEGVGELLEGMAYLILKGSELAVGVCSKLFAVILDFGFENLDAVQHGWTITRDIVNMFFILGLVIIAFATILKIETYSIKALLPKLIIIALLINFSFVICGIFIDAGQITTNFFINGIKGGDKNVDISEKMADGLLFSTQVLNIEEQKEEFSGDTISFILSMLFTASFLFLAAAVFLIGAVLLIIRVCALWTLIVLAPFAWFFSIFPALKSQSQKWWTNFFKWTFFAPIYTFFIYITFKISSELTFGTGTPKAGNFGDQINIIAQYIFPIILLLGAPMVALSMGITGSKAVIGFARGAFTGARKGAGKWAGAKISAPTHRPAKGLSKALSLPIIRHIPGMAAIGRAADAWGDKGTTRINELAKKNQDLPAKEIRKKIKLAGNPYARMALIQNLSEAPELSEDPDNPNFAKNKKENEKNRKVIKSNINKYEKMGGNVAKDVVANNFKLARNDNDLRGASAIRGREGKIALKENEANDIRSVNAMRNVLGAKNFINAINKMPEKISDEVAKALLVDAKASQNPLGKESMEQRDIYAKLTTKIGDAFDDIVDKKHVEKYTREMSSKELSKVSDDKSIIEIAKYIDTGTAKSMRKELSRDVADKFGANFSSTVRGELKKNDASWASNIP